MASRPRLLPLVGAYNFRDLGGYRTVDGRTTRWGTLYRSDGLHELTEADLETLRDLGLKSIVDLRTGAELERTGRGLLQTEPIRHLHLSVMQEVANDKVTAQSLADLDLASLYLQWLDSSRALVEALRLVCDPTNYPLVFHCAAGKDRTGVLAALVLDILGVERATVVTDYSLTAERLDLIRARQKRNDPETAARMVGAPHLYGADARTMERFLEGLDADHGGARQWALSAGISVEALAGLTSLLVA
jgi:protein-tyrosine phosphatase